jgi:hypothetical protein
MLIKSFLVVIISVSFVYAGPPFFTDDPQPVDFMHWEFYLSSAMQYSGNDADVTLPHIETNYGIVPDVQIHLILPMQYIKRESAKQYGYSSTEVGVKYRFINEESGLQVGIFPLAEIPTGKNVTLAGDNKFKTFLPLWIQETIGKYTTYGGAGYWINPGTGNKNWFYAGWMGQYDFSETITFGGELYYQTASAQGASVSTGFSIGGYINLNEHNHILFAAGHNISGGNFTTGYIGYQLTI